jgi:two-component system, OmpR family, sensor histidine kinase KdpD
MKESVTTAKHGKRAGAFAPRRRATGRTWITPLGVATAVLVPAAATGLALAVPHDAAASAATIYLLGVVAATVVGGLWSGLIASVISFLALNFFFTAPKHTFTVRHAQDIVALAVFLAVAAVVGVLVGRLLEARYAAERRADETARLQSFTSLLMLDWPLGSLLQRAAAEIVDSLKLRSCSIEVSMRPDTTPLRAVAGQPSPSADGGATEATELTVGAESRRLGTIRAEMPPGRELTGDEARLLGAFAGQLALRVDRAASEAEAQSARLDAEANKLRAALFSSVTHDLRTPLASIKASVTALLDSPEALSPVQREDLLRTSLEEADRLNRLVGNLLDLARLRAGALTPAAQRTGVEDVVEAVIARLRPMLKPFRVRTQIRADLPEVMIDPVQIDQVLTNVLENAARYSPPGSEIRVAVARFHGAVEVTVADRGPGILPENRERVFEPFQSMDAGRGRGGTGLGLAIARAVVEAHGGRISMEGAPGGGTAVVIRLPVAPRPELDRAGTASLARSGDAEQ